MEKKEQHIKGGKIFAENADATIAIPTIEERIEDLAWGLFNKRMNLSWKRPLTPKERQSVIDADPEHYQKYRDEAIKIFAKRERALDNKQYPEVVIPPDGKSGMYGGAYTICFVYSKYKGNVVVKGYRREVKKYVEETFKTHYFCNYSLWHLGENRDIWEFWKNDVHISQPHRTSKAFKGKDRWKFKVYVYADLYYRHDETEEKKKERESKILWFKRMPKRWIPEFDKF